MACSMKEKAICIMLSFAFCDQMRYGQKWSHQAAATSRAWQLMIVTLRKQKQLKELQQWASTGNKNRKILTMILNDDAMGSKQCHYNAKEWSKIKSQLGLHWKLKLQININLDNLAKQ